MNIATPARLATTTREHYHCQSALKVLGITMTRRQIRETDRDWLLHDVRAAYKARMKECHPDKGGNVKEAQAINAAKRALERILRARVLRTETREEAKLRLRARYRRHNPHAKHRA